MHSLLTAGIFAVKSPLFTGTPAEKPGNATTGNSASRLEVLLPSFTCDAGIAHPELRAGGGRDESTGIHAAPLPFPAGSESGDFRTTSRRKIWGGCDVDHASGEKTDESGCTPGRSAYPWGVGQYRSAWGQLPHIRRIQLTAQSVIGESHENRSRKSHQNRGRKSAGARLYCLGTDFSGRREVVFCFLHGRRNKHQRRNIHVS